ncbi:MAG: hypothetical protein RIT27_2051 [Pseudomonadota bacterium]|jgi:SAM-dependent methyltransferase
MPTFSDHFSALAPDYVQYRPLYPIELVDYLSEIASSHALIWDCGCGNGQLSTLLTERFQQVIATDASPSQIHHAISHPNINYFCEPADQSSLDTASVDLIVAAQAAHWFDLPAFYAEARRVAKPHAPIVFITYNLLQINESIDALILDFYQQILGDFWSPERRHVENNYADLLFPFERLSSPALEIKATWTLNQVLKYINTWSAIRPAKQALGLLPFETFEKALKKAWGDLLETRQIRWSLTIMVGKLFSSR